MSYGSRNEMTALTRRHVIAGTAATVAAAALPAVAVADAFEAAELVAPAPSYIIQFNSTADFLDFIAAGSKLSDVEWEFI
jgi:hypothetical protein